MRTRRTQEIEPVRNQRSQKSSTGGTPLQLRLAERPARDRVQLMVDLAHTLLNEVQTLARDKAFSDETNRVQALNLSTSIDLYAELERFEVGIITRVLKETGGNQARAAKLLRINPTTLNYKIKVYGIKQLSIACRFAGF
jgi:DNA-binding protein Fis